MTKSVTTMIAVLALAAGLSAQTEDRGAEPDRHLEHGTARAAT